MSGSKRQKDSPVGARMKAQHGGIRSNVDVPPDLNGLIRQRCLVVHAREFVTSLSSAVRPSLDDVSAHSAASLDAH